ncbi:MAG: ATP-binding protein [Gammaproteobacteria bacterium]|nr:ATP-binding protein [Gammaproteobacteria bacterium]
MFKLKLPAEADRLALVRSVVQRALENVGCSKEKSQNIVIAINEACMNIIIHAYKDGEEGEFELELSRTDSGLCFRLTDQAPPIELESVKSRDLDDIRPGGLGIHFIKEIMDEFIIGHLEGNKGNYMEMLIKLD